LKGVVEEISKQELHELARLQDEPRTEATGNCLSVQSFQNLSTEVEDYMMQTRDTDLRERDKGRDRGEEEEAAMDEKFAEVK